MTIYDDDGNEKEKVQLHTITEKPLLHQLMKDKGFVLKSPEEISAMKQHDEGSRGLNWMKLDPFALAKRREHQEALRKRRMDEKEYLGYTLPSYSSMFGFYGVALVSVGVFARVARRRRQKRSLVR